MHECRITQERLIDLVFDELEPAARKRLLAEIAGCHTCWDEYLSISQTLQVFDRITEHVTPKESYWPGYEARLRARIAQETSAGSWQYLKEWIAGFNLQLAPLAVTVALVLMALVFAGLWLGQRIETHHDQPLVDNGKERMDPSPNPSPSRTKQDVVVKNSTGKPKPGQMKRRLTPRQIDLASNEPPREEPIDMQASGIPSDLPLTTASFINPETNRHLEQAQMLLRSFRNTKADEAAGDLEYEKKMSRRLLYQNILLRREAEAKGILPTEEVLGTLEPLLLDIANLPDKPGRDEVRSIKERIGRQEMIALLHTYTAQPVIANLQ
jgi:hypothetical protein